MILKRYIQSLKFDCDQPIKLLVGNASIHISNESRRAWAYYGFEINALPAYSPNLAPVELVFALSKKQISKQSARGTINFQNRSRKLTIMNSFINIDREVYKGLWSEFVKYANMCILGANRKMRERNTLEAYVQWNKKT